MPQKYNAILALEDGSTFQGTAFGAHTTTLGEAVFNTSMTGYGEILTDPSYFGQIIALTPTHVGNYGINPNDEESTKIHARGLLVRDLCQTPSNWRSQEPLQDYLKRHNIPGISNIDIRALVMKLRSAGTLKACISTENISPEEAVKKAKAWEGLENVDCAKAVTTKNPYDYSQNCYEKASVLSTNFYKCLQFASNLRTVAVDFGAKRSIFNKLSWAGFDVKVVPATASADEILSYNPDGVFLSNGPGDPAAPTYAHEMVRQLLGKVPIFGICMGHQILAKALGATTYKLKFGHRGGNQPVKNIETGKVSITAQNHGYAVDAQSLEASGGVVTEVNLNDGTVSGLRHSQYPAFSVQYHPEGGPGPNDAEHHFEAFRQLILKSKNTPKIT